MLRIEGEPRKLDPREWGKRDAAETDAPRLVDEPFQLWRGSELLVHYEILPDVWSLREALRVCQRAPIQYARRTAGMVVNNAIFGSQPRNAAMRVDACRVARWYAEDADAVSALTRLAGIASEQYRRAAPDRYATHLGEVQERIRPEWRMGETPFTSGVINKSAAMRYHLDRGNLKGCWSAMVALKPGTRGGHLCLPEYGLRVEVADRSLLLFNGQNLLHGVTPIFRTRPGGERYTIVFYSLEQLWRCVSPEEEVHRADMARSKIDRRRGVDGDVTTAGPGLASRYRAKFVR